MSTKTVIASGKNYATPRLKVNFWIVTYSKVDGDTM